MVKVGIRKPNLKSSFKARTTGKANRALKRMIVPGYGKKGAGWIKNPKKAAYNAIYHRTTVGVGDLARATSKTTKKNRSATSQRNQSYEPYAQTSIKQLKVKIPFEYNLIKEDGAATLKAVNLALILCIFLGYLGAHRFYTRKWGSAILYLFTGGLFFVGWIRDICVLVKLRRKVVAEHSR